jgi:YD repeat-containing protein
VGALNRKYDVTRSYTWDADGNMLSVGGGVNVTMIYDALDRMIEQTASGTNHTQIVYGPSGQKLAIMNGQTFVKAVVNLPGSHPCRSTLPRAIPMAGLA